MSWPLLPIAIALGFSWIGFNPTDDGWLQAVARRLLEGEIPHRDFIFVRPALSAVLQIPLTLWGGDYVIWLSRLWGWLTLGAVCWIWSGRVCVGDPWPVRYALYAVGVLLCGHSFPVMAWHTLDGMLLASLAVACIGSKRPGARHLAFFIAGLAALTRQNFAFFPPLLLLAVGGPMRSWFAAGFWSALPSLLYLAGLATQGAAAQFLEQVTAPRGQFLEVALLNYGRQIAFPSGLVSAAAAGWMLTRASVSGRPMWPASAFAAVGLGGAIALWHSPHHYQAYSSALFGAVTGLAVALSRRLSCDDRLTLVAGLGLTWVTAVSIGYRSPALASGVALLLLWRLLRLLTPTSSHLVGALAVVLPLVSVSFHHARHQFPYRDRPSSQLRHDAGDALPGAAGLQTNALTHATLLDLRRLTRLLEQQHRTYAILTDFSAFWVNARPRNPLLVEWPQETELAQRPEYFSRLFTSLAALPPGSRLIVQKHLVELYAWTPEPVSIPTNASFYYAQHWVKASCVRVAETAHFELYLPPGHPAGP